MSDWRERLDEFGVPPDAVAAAVRETLGELTGQAGRIENAVRSHPFINANQQAIGAYLTQTPEVAARAVRLMNEDPEVGLDYVALKFQHQHGGPAQRGGDQGFPLGRSATLLPLGVDDIRGRAADWGYTRSGAGYTNTPQQQQTTPQPIRQTYDHEAEKAVAWQEYQRTGSKQAAKAYGHLRLREAISDDFLNQ